MKRSIRRRGQRGFAMVFAMFIVMLLLVIGLAMLGAAAASSSNTLNNETKHLAYDSAEAGLNQVIADLDSSRSYSSATTGTLSNGYQFSSTITNNLAGALAIPFTDPITGNTVTIPPGRAVIVSTGQGPNGERPTTVEAIVKDAQVSVSFPNDAIDAGLDIQGNWNWKIGVAGSSPGANDANIHANHNITATIGFLQGTATASGTTDSLNSSPGGINTPQRILPTSQMSSFVAAQLQRAQAGGPYALYIPGTGSPPSSFACPSGAPSYGCTVFFDGPLSIAGGTTISFTGRVIFVVNGDYSSTGNSSLAFQPGTQSLFVVNGNAKLAGNGGLYALMWAKGDASLKGNGYQTGALVAGGNVTFNGGGSGGGFMYDKTLANFNYAIPGSIVISTYGEY